MEIARTARFKKAWKDLGQAERKLAVKALQNLVENMWYPALRIEKIQGVDNIWEARISRSLRMTFQIRKDVIVLRNIGKHDETLERP